MKHFWLLLLVLLPAVADAQQVILTTREQQSLKALMGPFGDIEQLIIRETVAQPVLSSPGFARIMADSTTHTLLCSFNGGAYASCLGGGGGDVVADGTLTNNILVLGAGTSHIKSLGSAGTSTTVLHGGLPPTFSAIVSADLNITTTSCGAGQHVSAISSGGVGTCTPDTGVTGPAGSNGQVQFNNSGVFGADSTFLWNNTNKNLTVGGGTYALISDFDASIAPTKGFYAVLGSNASPDTTGNAVAMFEKFSNTTSTVNANAVVAIQGKKAMTGADTRLLGLGIEVIDTVGGTDSFLQAGEFKGLLQGATDGKVWGYVADAIIKSPATGFQSAIAGELAVHNKAQDYGFQSEAALAVPPAHFSAAVMAFPSCEGVPSCVGYFPIDVGVYVGNPFGGLAGGLSPGIFIKTAQIAASGNYLTAENWTVTKAGQTQLASGSSSAPAYSFIGDTNNGWYRPGADTQAWVTGGTERLRIGSSGDITLGPTTQLLFTETGGGTDTVGLKAPASVGTSLTWTLPNVDGAVGTCLSTNGSGVLGWANCSSGGTGLTSLNGQTGSTQTFTNETNLQISSAADAHALVWAGTLATARGGLGGNFGASSGVLSINSGTVIANNVLTAGQVLYAAAGNTVSSESAFTWDATNDRLNLGGSVEAYRLNITATGSVGDGIHIQGNATNTEPSLHLKSTGSATVRSYGLRVAGAGGGVFQLVDNTAGSARMTVSTLGAVALTPGPLSVGTNIGDATYRAYMVGQNDRTGLSFPLALLSTETFPSGQPLTLQFALVGSASPTSRAVVLQSLESGTANFRILALNNSGGPVTIATLTPGSGSALTVAGQIESTSGGVKFPDATTQTSAACGFSASCAWTGSHTWATQAAITLLPFGVSAGNTSEVRFRELAAGGSNYVGFKAPDSIAANIMWSLPNADGAAGQCLATNGLGGLSWAGCSPGIGGAGAAGRVTFWSSATGLSSNANFAWDDTNVGFQLTRNTLNAINPQRITGTISGNRTGLGSFQIPQMYGPSITEISYVSGLGISVEDTSTTNAPGATNDGFASHAIIARHNCNAGFTGYCIGISSYMTSSRNSIVGSNENNDTYGFLSFVRSNDSVSVNTIGMYSQLTVDTSQGGAKAALGLVLSNHTNVQSNRHGLTIALGDVTDTSAGSTNFQADNAIAIFATAADNGAVTAWTNLIHAINGDSSTRFRVDGNGILNVVDGNVSNPAIGFINDPNVGIYRPGADTLAVTTGGVQRLVIGSAGDVQINKFAGGGNRTVCIDNGGVLFAVTPPATC